MNIAKEIKYWSCFLAAAILISLVLTFFEVSFIFSIRAILGLVYVLFLPGYIVVREFFKEEMDWIEKLALSLGLSIPLVILSVMFSNMLLKIPITSLTNFLVLLGVMIMTIIIGRYRGKIKSDI